MADLQHQGHEAHQGHKEKDKNNKLFVGVLRELRALCVLRVAVTPSAL